MFYDAILRRMSRPGEKCLKVVSATREKIYYRKVRNAETGKLEEVEAGRGSEIVSELWTGEAGLKVWEAAHPAKTSEEEKTI